MGTAAAAANRGWIIGGRLRPAYYLLAGKVSGDCPGCPTPSAYQAASASLLRHFQRRQKSAEAEWS
jgi:hypothetical protein